MAAKPKKRKILIITGRVIDKVVECLDNNILTGFWHNVAETFKQVVEVLGAEDESNWTPAQNSLYAVVVILGDEMEASPNDEPVDAFQDVVSTLG